MQISRSMFYSLVSASLIGVGILATGCNKGAKENQSTTEQQPTVEQLSRDIEELRNMYISDSLAHARADLGKAQEALNKTKKNAAKYIYGDSSGKYANMSTEDFEKELKSNKKLVDDDMNQRCRNKLDVAQKKYDIATGSVMRHDERMLDQKVAELEKRLKN